MSITAVDSDVEFVEIPEEGEVVSKEVEELAQKTEDIAVIIFRLPLRVSLRLFERVFALPNPRNFWRIDLVITEIVIRAFAFSAGMGLLTSGIPATIIAHIIS